MMDISDLRSRTFEHTAYTASVLVPWCGTVPVAHTKIDKIQNDNAIIYRHYQFTCIQHTQ